MFPPADSEGSERMNPAKGRTRHAGFIVPKRTTYDCVIAYISRESFLFALVAHQIHPHGHIAMQNSVRKTVDDLAIPAPLKNPSFSSPGFSASIELGFFFRNVGMARRNER